VGREDATGRLKILGDVVEYVSGRDLIRVAAGTRQPLALLARPHADVQRCATARACRAALQHAVALDAARIERLVQPSTEIDDQAVDADDEVALASGRRVRQGCRVRPSATRTAWALFELEAAHHTPVERGEVRRVRRGSHAARGRAAAAAESSHDAMSIATAKLIALRAADDRGVDTHDLAARAQQRPPRVAGFSAASVWITSGSGARSTERMPAPERADDARRHGVFEARAGCRWPIAISPRLQVAERPSGSGASEPRDMPSMRSTARSVSGSSPTQRASNSRPSLSEATRRVFTRPHAPGRRARRANCSRGNRRA
jgi:hypothetical protein